ncbi:ABC transporter ATP-binding protein [Heyndrickxia acidiproducens]|uniref:ABC transporter ATP-binding protein n=1 Tax=Heyndrickxia acidiproducens TaxID=1121084 RepID=UPI0003788F0D|nr:ABC transporter ATP-binding protein [Heyndrickxia acidiproducens]
MISFKQVSKQYDDGTEAVKLLDIEVKDGEFFVLIGPSGCGKTTTLKMINRLIGASSGTVSINGKPIHDYDIHELRWGIGYVLQQIALFPHMTISENIAVVPEMKKWSKKKISARVDELLHMVGLEPSTYRNRKPGELSGGQQQRIGVLRALAADPEILLMDEPFSALDPFSREKLQDDLLKIQRTIKKTIVFVTHDMKEAMKLGDRVCLMKDGQVVQIGTPSEIVSHPVNDFVREFVGMQKLNPDWHDLLTSAGETVLHGQQPVPYTMPLNELLERISEAEAVPVEKNGRIIGMIHRSNLLRRVAQYVKEGGRFHE